MSTPKYAEMVTMPLEQLRAEAARLEREWTAGCDRLSALKAQIDRVDDENARLFGVWTFASGLARERAVAEGGRP